MVNLNKSKGLAFILDDKDLDHPIKFYNGLYSNGSYIGKYLGNLIYISAIRVKCFKYGILRLAKKVVIEHIQEQYIINKEITNGY